MVFPDTPHQLSRIAARFMLIFILAPFVISLANQLFLALTWMFPTIGPISTADQISVFWYSWILSIMYSPVFPAFGYTLLGWLIASVGVLVASRGPALAAVIFAFAAFAASPGLRNDYWFVTVPSVVVLAWLALAAWSLRKYVQQVQLKPGEAESVHQQHHAHRQREISTQQLISRR